MQITIRSFSLSCLLAVLTAGGLGCGRGHRPIFRMGSCFGSITKVNFHDLSDLGRHNSSERNGMVGTCRWGFIDLGHLRNAADVTRWLATDIQAKMLKNEGQYKFSLTDPSKHFVDINYPENWQELPESEREAISKDIAIDIASYGAYTGTTWHEIITYLGWKPVGIPVFISALAPEDNYSNLLGAIVGNIALKDTELSYNDAVTKVMNEEFTKLGIQPKADVKEASKRIYGVWYKGGGYFFAKTLRRHLDIGVEGDNEVAPWLIPGLCELADAHAYPVPDLDFSEYGFSVEYSIKPAIRKKVGRVLGEKVERIQPEVHFAKIMEHIHEDVMERFGPLGDGPEIEADEEESEESADTSRP